MHACMVRKRVHHIAMFNLLSVALAVDGCCPFENERHTSSIQEWVLTHGFYLWLPANTITTILSCNRRINQYVHTYINQHNNITTTACFTSLQCNRICSVQLTMERIPKRELQDNTDQDEKKQATLQMPRSEYAENNPLIHWCDL